MANKRLPEAKMRSIMAKLDNSLAEKKQESKVAKERKNKKRNEK